MVYSVATYWSWEFTCFFSFLHILLQFLIITEIKLFKIRPTEQEDHPPRPFCWCLKSSEAVQSGKGSVTKTLIIWDVTVWHCASGAFVLDCLTLKMKALCSFRHHKLLVWCSVVSQKPRIFLLQFITVLQLQLQQFLVILIQSWYLRVLHHLETAVLSDVMLCTQIHDCQCCRKNLLPH